MKVIISPQALTEARNRIRGVLLKIPDTPEVRANEAQLNRLQQLLNDDSAGAVKLLAEMAEFVQFGRLYLLTIEDMGPIE